MEDGAQFTGVVRNETYRFSATIPQGKRGWGVQAPAPFHGFAIFLEGQGRWREGDSCIDFDVGVRVDLPEDSVKSAGDKPGRSISIGNRKGYETIRKESIGHRAFLVVWAHLDLPGRPGGEGDYVSVMLISPAATYAANRKVFNRFLSDLVFW